jgi:antitoxin HicB
MQYPATFTPAAEGGYVITFRDIPEAITQGDDEADAMFQARDVLAMAMGVYFDEKRSVPRPSAAKRGERLVDLPVSVSAKVLLLNQMLAERVGPSELARRMHTTPQEVNRLIDLAHTSKIDRIQQALNALGKRLELELA